MENGEKRCTLTHTDSTCFREETVSETSIAYQLEYQSDKRFLKIFKPKIGFLGTSKNAHMVIPEFQSIFILVIVSV